MTERLSEFKTYVKEEFIHHLPYTVLGAVAGLVFALITMRQFEISFGENEFHYAHFTHLLFSGAASAAIFKSYRDSAAKAVPVAYVSSLVFCTVSDVLIPALGLTLFGFDAEIHICFFEYPFWVSLSILAGCTMGLVGIRFFNHCNRGFHLLHLFLSTTASTVYMLLYIPSMSVTAGLAIGVTLIFALAIPCLVGDMILPLYFVKIRDEFTHKKVHHPPH